MGETSQRRRFWNCCQIAHECGLKIICACAELNASTPTEYWKMEPEHYKKTIPRVIGEYGNSTAPTAWCLGDEPPAAVADKYKGYCYGWDGLTGGLPSCVVTRREDTEAYKPLVSHVCTAAYPIRIDWSWSTSKDYWLSVLGMSNRWVMGQLHSGQQWGLALPTPAEASWMIYTAAVYSKTGCWMFSWNYPTRPDRLLLDSVGTAFKRVRSWPDTSRWMMDIGDNYVRAYTDRHTIIIAGPTSSVTLNVPGFRLRNVETGQNHFGWWFGYVRVTVSAGNAVWLERMI